MTINAETITSLYLYDSVKAPKGKDLLNESLIRPINTKGQTVKLSNSEFDNYMINGAGRFANASLMKHTTTPLYNT